VLSNSWSKNSTFLKDNPRMRIFLTLVALIIVSVGCVSAGERAFEFAKEIWEIASLEPGKIIVYTKDREVCWLNVTPSGLRQTASIQLGPRDHMKAIFGNRLFPVLWLARNQDVLNVPQPAKRLVMTFDANGGGLLDERTLRQRAILSRVVISKHEITHESIVESWKINRRKDVWYAHAVDKSVKYLDRDVVIYDDVAVTDHLREIKVIEWANGKISRFVVPHGARLVAATAQRGEWRFFVNDGGWIKLYSKGAAQPTDRKINDFRIARAFPGGCIVETEDDIMVFPWSAESEPWVVRKRENQEWVFGGNERYGVAAVIGSRKVFQFDWTAVQR
jgi:hypothetical protein